MSEIWSSSFCLDKMMKWFLCNTYLKYHYIDTLGWLNEQENMDPMVAASELLVAPILCQEGYGFGYKGGNDKIAAR